MLHSPRRGKESTGSEIDSFGAELIFRFRTAQADRGHGNRLVVLANAQSRMDAVGLRPTFDKPQRVSAADGESFGGSAADRMLRRVVRLRDAERKFAQDSIDEWSCGTLASAFDEFDALMNGSTCGNASERELINRETECRENLKIEFGKWLVRNLGNFRVEQ